MTDDGEGHGSCTGSGCDCDEKRYGKPGRDVYKRQLFNWSRGIGCSQERKEIIEGARSFIGAYIEQAVLSGKISPPSGIFIMKNWLSYKDTISFEETMPREEARTALTAADLPKLGLLSGVGISNE